jgi:hypothetical protein
MRQLLRPDPHPLDFDWRFDKATIGALAQRIPKGRSLLMGCPSLAEALAEEGREVSLVDWQPLTGLSDRINHVQADLRFDSLGDKNAEFDTVVMDSPWYLDYLNPWITQARRHIRPGGLILFSLWPSDTRPLASLEADDVLHSLESFGSFRLDRGALGYVTPKFELETASAGGHSLRGNWRRGDLVTVKVGLPQSSAKCVEHPIYARIFWQRYVFDSLQIAVRLSNKSGSDEPALISITKGNVLPDVSRRLEIRPAIDLWTSGNVAFSVRGSFHFVEALDRTVNRRLVGMSKMASRAHQLLLDANVLGRGPYETQYSWMHRE